MLLFLLFQQQSVRNAGLTNTHANTEMEDTSSNILNYLMQQTFERLLLCFFDFGNKRFLLWRAPFAYPLTLSYSNNSLFESLMFLRIYTYSNRIIKLICGQEQQ